MTCCTCGSTEIILYAAEDQRPWCRPCAQAVGTRMLKREHPSWFANAGAIPDEP